MGFEKSQGEKIMMDVYRRYHQNLFFAGAAIAQN
jgi:hypothetical protein